ncbi:MAG TPA: SIMPL domain-containing protein [Myxococcota bacterium]|nr:SIMPL domain-containing protein [Myxococcota bacterium]
MDPIGRMAALLLAVGIAVGGWLVGQGFERARAGDRYVTVKGVSERDVKADLAIWPLRLSVANDDLAKAHAEIQRSVEKIHEFLGRHDLDPASAQVQGFAVRDANADPYRSERAAGSRFVINETLVVRSTEPDKIAAATEKVGELVEAGVVLSSGGNDYRSSGATYIFSGLNAIKPEMIAEATARAREGAEQFARDSRARVGRIRRASQGTFEILARDRMQGASEENQMAKTVRVVSTVDYLLED